MEKYGDNKGHAAHVIMPHKTSLLKHPARSMVQIRRVPCTQLVQKRKEKKKTAIKERYKTSQSANENKEIEIREEQCDMVLWCVITVSIKTR